MTKDRLEEIRKNALNHRWVRDHWTCEDDLLELLAYVDELAAMVEPDTTEPSEGLDPSSTLGSGTV